MKQRELSLLLKAAIVVTVLGTLLLLSFFAYSMGDEMRMENPEVAYLFWPCLIFLWASSLPFFAALLLGWRIATDMGRNRSFCHENAQRLKWVCWLALLEAAVYIGAVVTLGVLHLASPGIALLLLFTVAAGLVVAVIAAVLSHLVDKAVALQQENDLTV